MLPYPATTALDDVEHRHGVRIPNPYGWLDDLESDDTVAWVRAQNEFTSLWLASLDAGSVRERLAELLVFQRWTPPVKRGGRSFLTWNDGTRDQAVLCLLREPGADPLVLVDPNEWSADGTVALTAFVPNHDGSIVGYAIARAGSDWNEWRCFDLDAGWTLDDCVERVRFSSIAWAKDEPGFFYTWFDDADVAHLRFHRIGDRQEKDDLVYDRPDEPGLRFQPAVGEDGRWLVIYLFEQHGGTTAIVVRDLLTGKTTELPGAFAARYGFCGNDGATLWFTTDLGAPRGRFVGIDMDAAEPAWREIIPESADTLQWVLPKEQVFLAGYLRDACTVVRRFGLDGAPEGIAPLPGIGWAGGFGGERADPESAFLFMTFTQPPALHRYDVDENRTSPLFEPPLRFDPARFVTRQEVVRSKDGTSVPLFLTYEGGLVPDGARPVLQWGYGGFGIPVVPWFWPLAIAWMERGGIFAVPAIRGGGEFGQEWHAAGCGSNKQNSFDDFIATAEWLIERGYTQPSKIAIAGASNGGLLVGACITQRPELFGAASIDMGLLDMLHLDRVPVGIAMVDEYGKLDDEEDFRRMFGYSPLHNVRPGVRYPATIITTGDHDELVVPSNSYKFGAALQAAQQGPAPVLLRVEFDTGHGSGKAISKVAREQADVLRFLLAAVGEL